MSIPLQRNSFLNQRSQSQSQSIFVNISFSFSRNSDKNPQFRFSREAIFWEISVKTMCIPPLYFSFFISKSRKDDL